VLSYKQSIITKDVDRERGHEPVAESWWVVRTSRWTVRFNHSGVVCRTKNQVERTGSTHYRAG